MRKVISILLCFIVSIVLLGCEVNINDQFDDEPQGDLSLDISELSVADIYQSCGVESEYGHIYGDYVFKQEVYLAPYFSRLIFPYDGYADGYVYHFVESPLIEYKNIDIDLSKYFDEEYIFKYNNNFDYKNIENIIYMKEYKDLLSINSPKYKENILFIAEDKTLYLANGNFNIETNNYSFSVIQEMEYLSCIKPVSQINNYQNAVISSKKEGMKYDKFITLIPDFINADYSSINRFISSCKALEDLEDYCVFSTSGVFHKVYMIGNQYIFSINIGRNGLCIELMYLKDGIVVETVKDPNKLSKLIYKYNYYLLDESQISDVNENNSNNEFYSLKTLDNVDSVSIFYHSNSLSSYIHHAILKEDSSKEEINKFKDILSSLVLTKEDSTNPYVYDGDLWSISTTYSITYGDLTLLFDYELNTLDLENKGTYKIVSDTNELFKFINEKLYGNN